ncbi:MAG: pyruvate kinase [Gammaproteobacteria bacterium]|nr:MAG: pyruvate kinase [Gammaproteobacteria bacterium]
MTHIPRIRKTKIVATIGPACDSVETLIEMIRAGMNVARLNLSHGTHDEQSEKVKRIRQASRELNTSIAIMVDTRGVEIRTGKLENRTVELIIGDEFVLYTDERMGDIKGVSVSFPDIVEHVKPGENILIDDGALELKALEIKPDAVRCEVIHGGILKENKSVNLPSTTLPMATASPEGREDVLKEMNFAVENDVEYIAASFIQSADDIIIMRQMLEDMGTCIPLIAKIENKAGVNNLDSIVQAADGMMVARGDMGVELPFGEVPIIQKRMIRTTVENGKPVITATQMLASMEFNPKPTRAEASDVANAILDGSSAVMLSGETAAGLYPVESVRTMADLAVKTEAWLEEYGYLQATKPNPSFQVTEAVAQGAVSMAKKLDAAAIFTLTMTGTTSRLVSKHRPVSLILAITESRKVARRLALNWGVLPILYSAEPSDEARIQMAMLRARELGYVKNGDTIIVTAGQNQRAGGTDLIRVMTIE